LVFALVFCTHETQKAKRQKAKGKNKKKKKKADPISTLSRRTVPQTRLDYDGGR